MPKLPIQSNKPKAGSPTVNGPPSLAQRLSAIRDDFFRNNQEKYLILGNAVCLAREVDNDLSLRVELDNACKTAGFCFRAATPELNRILRYMTDDEQGRANNFAAALRKVPSDRITPNDIAAFITEAGGLQKLRLSGGNAGKARLVPQLKKNDQVQPHDDGALDKLMRSVGGNASAHIVQHQAGAGTPKLPISAGESVGSDHRDQTDEQTQPGQQVEPDTHTLVPHEDADEQPQAAQQGVAGQDFKTIARSAVNADTLPKQSFFMMGGKDAKTLMYIDDDPILVRETADYVRARLKSRHAGVSGKKLAV